MTGILAFLVLIPFAAAGMALMNSGLCRSRNAAHAVLSSLTVAGVASLAYCAFGAAVLGHAGSAGHVLRAAGRNWDWIGRGTLFGASDALYVLYGTFAAVVVCVIPLSSGAGRWRLGSACASAAILAAWTFPLFAHWAWSGWLRQFGFVDHGGAGAIHSAGGLTALAIAWILGPRRGKYTPEGMPMAVPGHNMVLVLSGCWLAWIGWIGLNGAGAILFGLADIGHVALAALNTTLSAAAGALAAAAITRARFGKPDASLCANGWAAGLVSASAGCAVMPPAGAALVGIVGGGLAIFTVEWLELHLSVDDPGGAISVHAVGGMWSLLAVSFFGGHWMSQLGGVATLLGFVLPLSYLANLVLNRVYPMRVSKDAERQGMDLHELGAGAYPDFASHEDW